MGTCRECSKGQYAPDPTRTGSCTNCKGYCWGRLQTPCQRIIHCMYECVDCPPIRANASCNGLDNCATSCWDGCFEMDSVCVPCAKFNQTTCPAGNYLKPWQGFYDAECLQCVNGSRLLLPVVPGHGVPQPVVHMGVRGWMCGQAAVAWAVRIRA
jgi:hypothetical protein